MSQWSGSFACSGLVQRTSVLNIKGSTINCTVKRCRWGKKKMAVILKYGSYWPNNPCTKLYTRSICVQGMKSLWWSIELYKTTLIVQWSTTEFARPDFEVSCPGWATGWNVVRRSFHRTKTLTTTTTKHDGFMIAQAPMIYVKWAKIKYWNSKCFACNCVVQ